MKPFVEQAPWWVAGPLIGSLIVGLMWASNKPLGALGGYVDTADRISGSTHTLGWRAYFALGVVLGGGLFALVSGPEVGFEYGSFDGLVPSSMVAKALWLGGCTSGHGMSGTASGSPSSFVATTTFMSVAIGVSFLLTRTLS
jgi:uncharacterized protein